jgi:hypothetical protein
MINMQHIKPKTHKMYPKKKTLIYSENLDTQKNRNKEKVYLSHTFRLIKNSNKKGFSLCYKDKKTNRKFT